MTRTPLNRQDLRQSPCVKAEAERSRRSQEPYPHVNKESTLQEAWRMARSSQRAPGSDGVAFGEELVRDAVCELLETLHEKDSLDCSCGFRPGRSAVPPACGIRPRPSGRRAQSGMRTE